MGALHSGHIALMKRSIKENDITVCSIFVNPTQFNVKSDLDKYPRTLKADAEKLAKANVDYLFAPSVKEVYPSGTKKSVKVNLKGLDKLMEGEFRPGHFEGVVQVVHRLLEIVKPTRLYMGQKDFQQFTIIAQMIKSLRMKVELVVVEIQRAKDGLALSSRNVRLTTAKRKWAPIINKELKRIKKSMKTKTVDEVIEIALDALGKPRGYEPEYVSIVDGNTLKPVKAWGDSDYIVVATAVWAGKIRLIDNMILKKP
ncbi:UNVERIFIED_CONTAM: hypothetical protein GTU68_029247 [Idotea baltica]|nr:hypothetical protein [Idotea baltica]